MSDQPRIEASGRQSVAVNINGGIVSTGDHATIDARTVHLSADALRSAADVGAPPGTSNLPIPADPGFVDRVEPLAQLEAALAQSGPAVSSVVHGLGGMGKSALASEVAHRHRHRYNPVWWITADSPASIAHGLAHLATHLAPHHFHTGASSAERATWALDWLRAHQDWLLVLDDASSPGDLSAVLGLPTGRYVITSRRSTGWRRLARPLTLAPLPPDAATELLAHTVEPDGIEDERELRELAEELGHLPLALEQAAAYMESTAIGPGTYRERLRRYPARMYASTPAGSDEVDNQRTIARIWRVSLQKITEREPLAGDLLRLLAWLAPDPLPRDVLSDFHQESAHDPLAVDEALGLLHDYSMITLTRRSVTVHALVQAVARTVDPDDPHRTAEAVEAARANAARMLEAALPPDPLSDASGWPRWRELLPHLTAFTDPERSEGDLGTAGLLLAASAFLQSDGGFATATDFARRSVDLYARLRGADHTDTLFARSFLASAYRATGDLEAATPLHELLLADCERLLGPLHPDTLVARANLAYLKALRGKPAQARDLHRRNLADLLSLHGPDHPHTVNARANLAAAHRDLGDLRTAIALHHETIGACERIHGPDHIETVTARSNLACTLQLAGHLDGPDGALALHENVLADRERAHGPDHRLTELARDLLARAHAAREPEAP
ncbi:tetratricopeptide repeat protein [Streptomyces sp. NPDC058953]|uniref:tetratricopeptide repeat protein n=1 Tax=unclassified Streptomyces TaxID=2593676 RepID=UPI0036CBE109